MTQPLDSLFSHSFEAICDFGLLSLSGADGMMRCQFSHTRELLALGGDRAQRAFALPNLGQEWQAAIAAASQDSLDSARQYTAALSRWQAESMRLIEQQAAAANALLKQSMDEAISDVERESAAPGESRSARSRKGEHKLAA